MTDMLTLNDCREIGFCAAGCRRRCNELGLDTRAFFRDGGLPIDQLRAYDDADIQRAILVAEKRIAAEKADE
jgi:hypothetical protein